MCLITACSVTVELHKTPLWIYVHLTENWVGKLRKNLSLSLALFSEYKLLLWNSEAASSSEELCAASFQHSFQQLHTCWFQKSAWREWSSGSAAAWATKINLHLQWQHKVCTQQCEIMWNMVTAPEAEWGGN